jgi:hypothetical protein
VICTKEEATVKQIAINVAGSDTNLIDTQIYPGTTVGEVLAQHNLQGYLLSTGPNSHRFFADDENLYPLVVDGDKLFATTKAIVGAIAH